MLYQILATIGIAAALLMIGFVICVLSDSMPPTSCRTGIKKIRQLEREKKSHEKTRILGRDDDRLFARLHVRRHVDRLVKLRPKRGRRSMNRRDFTSCLIKKIPRSVWVTFRRRQEIDSEKIGYWLTQEAVLNDLIRQYAEAVTYFGKRHVTAPPVLSFQGIAPSYQQPRYD